MGANEVEFLERLHRSGKGSGYVWIEEGDGAAHRDRRRFDIANGQQFRERWTDTGGEDGRPKWEVIATRRIRRIEIESVTLAQARQVWCRRVRPCYGARDNRAGPTDGGPAEPGQGVAAGGATGPSGLACQALSVRDKQTSRIGCPCSVAQDAARTEEGCRAGAAHAALPTAGTPPEVSVLNDCDGYFEQYVRALIAQKAAAGRAFLHQKIVVDSGPWRMYDVHYEEDGGCLRLDFYSVCRKRGGHDGGEEILERL